METVQEEVRNKLEHLSSALSIKVWCKVKLWLQSRLPHFWSNRSQALILAKAAAMSEKTGSATKTKEVERLLRSWSLTLDGILRVVPHAGEVHAGGWTMSG